MLSGPNVLHGPLSVDNVADHGRTEFGLAVPRAGVEQLPQVGQAADGGGLGQACDGDGQDWEHRHGPPEHAVEAVAFTNGSLYVGLQSLSLQLAHGAEYDETPLRECMFAEEAAQDITYLVQGAALSPDDDGTLGVLRGENGREALVSEKDDFPPPRPLAQVTPLRQEGVAASARDANPGTGSEAGAAHTQVCHVFNENSTVQPAIRAVMKIGNFID